MHSTNLSLKNALKSSTILPEAFILLINASYAASCPDPPFSVCSPWLQKLLQKSIVGSVFPATTFVLLLCPFASAGSVSLAALLLDRDCERDRLPWEFDDVGRELPPMSATIVCVSLQRRWWSTLLYSSAALFVSRIDVVCEIRKQVTALSSTTTTMLWRQVASKFNITT